MKRRRSQRDDKREALEVTTRYRINFQGKRDEFGHREWYSLLVDARDERDAVKIAERRVPQAGPIGVYDLFEIGKFYW